MAGRPSRYKMPITSLGLAEGLPALVEQKYVIAEAEKALTFSETQLAILHLDTIPVGSGS